jgi:integrase
MGKKGQFPPGVTPRQNSIQIKFKIETEDDYCYETFYWKPTPVNIAKAGKIRAEIVEKIKHGIFEYAEYFPNSHRAQNVSGTFAEYAQAWLDCPTNDWKPQSRYKFRGILQRVWIPSLHSLQVRAITPAKINNSLAEAVRVFKHRNGKEPSKSIYNDWLLCVRGVFDIATIASAIKKSDNPTQQLQNKTRDKVDADPFSITEANRIIEYIYENHGVIWGTWFELGFYTGMRYPSEPSALTWNDIDFELGEARINKIMTKAGLQNSTKTGKSRVLALNSRCRSALERLKAITLPMGPTVFVNGVGGNTFNAKAQRNMWRSAIENLGIRYRDMYNMRHTYATFGLMNGVNPAFMAGQLGHSLEEFFKTYAKWINSQQNETQISLIERAIESA